MGKGVYRMSWRGVQKSGVGGVYINTQRGGVHKHTRGVYIITKRGVYTFTLDVVGGRGFLYYYLPYCAFGHH